MLITPEPIAADTNVSNVGGGGGKKGRKRKSDDTSLSAEIKPDVDEIKQEEESMPLRKKTRFMDIVPANPRKLTKKIADKLKPKVEM